jgi:hypothetical protein
MVLVKMTHEEYVKFCKKIANKYLFGLIICTIITIFGFIMLTYGKAPLVSYMILATGFGISLIGLGTNFIHWRYG